MGSAKRFKQSRAASARSAGDAPIPVAQNFFHACAKAAKVRNLLTKRFKLPFCERMHGFARSAASVLLAEDTSKLRERETDGARVANEPHAINGFRRKPAVAGLRAMRAGKDADALVVPDRVWADARKLSQFADLQRP